MRTGRPKAALMVSAEQREELERWVRRRSTAQALALRARIILSCAEGGSNKDVASRLGMSRLTVGRWRSRFIRSGVDGLLDEPRPGAPRKISDAAVEKAVTLTLESKPRDATHWSTRSLAKRVGLSRSSVARIWRAFGLRPHRSESFKLSTEPLLIEKVRDIVSGSTWTRLIARSCCAWTRSPRFKRWIARSEDEHQRRGSEPRAWSFLRSRRLWESADQHGQRGDQSGESVARTRRTNGLQRGDGRECSTRTVEQGLEVLCGGKADRIVRGRIRERRRQSLQHEVSGTDDRDLFSVHRPFSTRRAVQRPAPLG